MSKEEKERVRKDREKAFRKENQRLAIEGIGKGATEQKNTDKESLKTKGETALKEAGTMISSSGSSLQESIKGQFGKKITEVFDKQQQTLDTF